MASKQTTHVIGTTDAGYHAYKKIEQITHEKKYMITEKALKYYLEYLKNKGE